MRPHRVEPLWDRVDRNRIELAVFIMLFLLASAFGSVLVLAFGIGGFALLTGDPTRLELMLAQGGRLVIGVSVAAMVLAGTHVVIALSRCERWLLRRFGATLVPRGEMLATKHALKDMALAAGFEVAPALYVIETRNVNAFVFAKGHRRPVVGVTRGLTERLTVDEQRAVFANLVARLRAGDTIWATGVSAIIAPLWTIRRRQMSGERDMATRSEPRRFVDPNTGREVVVSAEAETLAGMFWLMPLAFAFVFMSELIVFGHRKSHLRHGEVADAEGMLLLKDPQAMLSALEKCVRFNNYVPTAGPGFTQLFYLWTGEGSTDSACDPEYRRITRLREVLGVAGMPDPVVEPNEPVMAPVAPRLEGAAGGPLAGSAPR